MKIIKIDAITSTNDFLKSLVKNTQPQTAIAVLTSNQTKGKGQVGTSWAFEEGNSLAFSVFIPFSIAVQEVFKITIAVSLGVKKGFEELGLTEIAIKWPNDIMADGKKIAGILIENSWKNNNLLSTVLGVGVNVNHFKMPAFPQATSMAMVTKSTFEVDVVFQTLLKAIEKEFKTIESQNYSSYIKQYSNFLFKKDSVVVFEDVSQKRFNGIIKGVTRSGSLNVILDDETIKNFALKEVKLLY